MVFGIVIITYIVRICAFDVNYCLSEVCGFRDSLQELGEGIGWFVGGG